MQSVIDIGKLPTRIQEIKAVQQQDPEQANQLLVELKGVEEDESMYHFSPQEAKDIMGANPLPMAEEADKRSRGQHERLTSASACLRTDVSQAETTANLGDIQKTRANFEAALKPIREDIVGSNQVLVLLDQPDYDKKKLKSLKQRRSALVKGDELEELREALGADGILKKSLDLGNIGFPKGVRLARPKTMIKADNGLVQVDIATCDGPKESFKGHVEFELLESTNVPTRAEVSELRTHAVKNRREALVSGVYNVLEGPPSLPWSLLEQNVNRDGNQVEQQGAVIKEKTAFFEASASTHVEEAKKTTELAEGLLQNHSENLEQLRARYAVRGGG